MAKNKKNNTMKEILVGMAMVGAAVTTAVAGTYAYHAYNSIEQNSPGVSENNFAADHFNRTYRYMNAGEIEMAQEIFGDRIDYENVKLVHHKVWEKENASAYVMYAPVFGIAGNNIHFKAEYYCDDFSSDSCDAKTRSIFMHEMTHIYQNQNPDVTPDATPDDYDYRDTMGQGKRNFEDYNTEEQAELVFNYYKSCVLEENIGMASMSTDITHVGQVVEGEASFECDLNAPYRVSEAIVLHAHFNLKAPPPPPDYEITEFKIIENGKSYKSRPLPRNNNGLTS